MSFTPMPDRLYRMPVHFGPSVGPRQGPNGEKFDWAASPKRKTVSVSFLSDADKLARHTPEGITVHGEPVVTIELSYMTELEWLAGRGYATFGVRWPASFEGRQDQVVGSFLSILWENLPDPILSGRDELGFNKLFCELPAPRVLRGRQVHEASWMGHKFFGLELSDIVEVPVAELSAAQAGVRNDGLLHFKYVPRTGEWGVPDIASVTFTPATGAKTVIDRVWRATGTHEFIASEWEDLPTMFQVVNALRALPVVEYRSAWLIESHGGKDLGDQRTLV